MSPCGLNLKLMSYNCQSHPDTNRQSPICDGLSSQTQLIFAPLKETHITKKEETPLQRLVFAPLCMTFVPGRNGRTPLPQRESDNCCILFLAKILLRQHVDATDCRTRDKVRNPGGARVPCFSGLASCRPY